MSLAPPPPPPPPPPSPAAWQRLDPRMLLVHPVKEVGKFLPVLIGLVVAGSASGVGPWTLLGVGVPVGLGVVRYLTTTYRITGGRVELRRGLLQRHTLSTPVDRVRTVDLSASPIHRVLGLATVVIGTGSVASDSDERLELDALPREEAARLRAELLHAVAPAGTAAPGVAPEPERVVARFSARWLWYAPFSGTVLVGLGAIVGVGLQLMESVEIRVSEDDLAAIGQSFVLTLVVGAGLLVTLLAVGGYLVTNGGFVLSRHGTAWHVRRGLLTRRETSIDVARLAGATLGEPAALRVARGRRVGAIVTGLSGDQASSAVLLPPAPRSTGYDVVSAVLGTAAPVTGALLPHGRAATTRRYSRALLGALPFVAAVVAAVLAGAPGWLLPATAIPLVVALALAWDRARALGHAFLDGHVVMRSGSALRTRDALAAGHVIGWNQRATWFQRRAGLVSLAATTAGGKGQVHVPDVPVSAAIALAEAATPGLIGQFCATERSRP
ncbi:PH domain-containing protein [Nocardioides carbamazepini]|uniref:PH domain-containing protein n=1 Tax=Nocardioides carbamazepini TaxID=2854259 RepID=UPI00214A6683|nr:PH domain-containing protein [Nocardioides carbamazepini]MCR1782802.1 PH domain-containing protein [Nocardioides carbamazepini]